ncbi:MAG TPA: GNAT family N-acetyltransferase [Acidimicrobiales bacterium]|nr:GNAT family N-acetyltransferase [Acidimicrobiales bacterium]
MDRFAPNLPGGGLLGGTSIDVVVALDDPRSPDVQALLAVHLAFAREVTPPCEVHALDVEGLLDPMVSLFSARREGVVLGIGALRELDPVHGEIKSMHTAETARGQGVGRAIVDHLLAVAAERGYRRVSLETGATPEFAPARALYAGAGFEQCAPFGDYVEDLNGTCMTRLLA